MTRMYKSGWLIAMMLVAGVAGCSSNKRTASDYPAPIFDTAPVARHRPAPPRRVRPMRPQPAVPAPAPQIRTAYAEPGWMPAQGISRKWTDIVLHHSATGKGGARAFDHHHRTVNSWDELGYHFVIGNGSDTGDGQVEVGSRWVKQKHGAHCKTPDNYYNSHGVGICLVGDFSKRPPSAAQLASLDRLLEFLTSQCGISPSHISSHGGITHKTACPGRYFPLAQVRRGVAGTQPRYAGGNGVPGQLSRL